MGPPWYFYAPVMYVLIMLLTVNGVFFFLSIILLFFMRKNMARSQEFLVGCAYFRRLTSLGGIGHSRMRTRRLYRGGKSENCPRGRGNFYLKFTQILLKLTLSTGNIRPILLKMELELPKNFLHVSYKFFKNFSQNF